LDVTKKEENPMAKPSRERVREWRERKAKKGGRSLSVWLEPETAQMMDHLLKSFGETASPLIARAIKNLHNVTRDKPELVHSFHEEEKPAIEPKDESQERFEEEEGLGFISGDIVGEDALLKEMKEKLAEGVPLKDLKTPLLLEWIKLMKGKGHTFQAMADELNGAQIPTLSGYGQWDKGVLTTLFILNFR
jgi:hypothetical protein